MSVGLYAHWLKWGRGAAIILLLLAVAFAVYANSLRHPFMIDDHAFFDETKENIKFLPYQFLPDRNKALGIQGLQNDVYYRPMALVIPMLCRLAFQDNPFGFHVVNVILLCMASFTIYWFIRACSGDIFVGLAAGLMYLVHPINGVMVNFITASVFPAQVIFMFLSLRFWFFPSSFYFLSLAFSLVCFLFALMCHETAMALPLYALCLMLFFRRADFVQSARACLPYFIFLAVYFIWRLFYASLNNTILGNFQHLSFGAGAYAASFAKVVAWYITKLFFPTDIVLIWTTPVVRAHVGAWWFLLLAMIGFFVFLIWRWRRAPSMALGLSWFAVGFLPAVFACIFQPMHGFMLEPHWFAFSSIGFFWTIAALAGRMRERFDKKIVIATVGILIAVWGGAARAANDLWADEQRYCLYWLGQAPLFKPIKFYLARTYLAQGNLSEARRYYRESISHLYVDHLFYANLGMIDLMEGKLALARANYLKALRIEPGLPSALNNMGVIAIQQKDEGQAKFYFARAIAVDRFNIEGRLNMARIFQREDNDALALKMYKEILDIIPHHEGALMALLAMAIRRHDAAGLQETAAEIFNHSTHPMTLARLGISLAQVGDYSKASVAFEKLIRLEPRSAQAYLWLGDVRAALKDYNGAMDYWRRGLACDASNQPLRERLLKMSLWLRNE